MLKICFLIFEIIWRELKTLNSRKPFIVLELTSELNAQCKHAGMAPTLSCSEDIQLSIKTVQKLSVSMSKSSAFKLSNPYKKNQPSLNLDPTI